MTETEKELYKAIDQLNVKQKKALLAFLKTIVPAKESSKKRKS
jgi:hypothetical protein